jgi:outer membrane protein assembly factor BamA
VLTLPPDQLAKIGCDVSTPAGLAACNPNARRERAPGDSVPILGDDEFTPRPLGGNTLLEGNLEYRFRIWKEFGGALFVDGALVGQGTLGDVAKGTGAITPGFGVRYYSPVGPIRVDVGFNPYLSQDLTVVTEDTTTGRIVELGHSRTYAPARTEGSWFQRALNRVTLHFSIGQAF